MHRLPTKQQRHPTMASDRACRDIRTPIPPRLPAEAQPVFPRLSAFTRTFVRSQEPAAVAG
jgi:hypothetical protein